MENKLKELEKENHNLREQLENFIPRRRVRRVYKMLGDILEETPIERAKYTEEQAERLFSYLIYKVVKRYAN